MTVLMENVRHHVEEEEQEFFPKVRAELDRNALAELGRAMETAKEMAPSHPHPRSPDTPPGNLAAAAGAGMVDRIGDTVSGVAQGSVSAVQDLIGAVVGFYQWSKSPAGKPVWDKQVLKAPIFGSLIRMIAISRFTRTLATLLKSGVPLLGAMEIVKNVVTNAVLADVVEKARDAIREGESIATPLKRSGEFPPLVYHMVAIGEKSGQLEDMLLSVADNYENQVNVRIGALTSMLEPLLTVFMGVMIAFVAFSVLMPILQVNSAIR